MKQIFFDGRLGKDAEIKTTTTGRTFIHFSVANTSFVKGQEVTEWIDVYSFDPFVIETKSKVLKKGYYVLVTGSLDTKSSVGTDGKIYVNQRVNATSIEVPNVNNSRSENAQGQPQQISKENQPSRQVTTMQTITATETKQPITQQETRREQYVSAPIITTIPQASPNSLDDDELPF